MTISFSRTFEQPTWATLSVAMVFVGSFLILVGASIIGGAIAAAFFLLAFYWLLSISYKNLKILVFNIAIIAIIFSPYVNYAKEIGDVRYFGSAYGADFQQYLAVLWSLAMEGLPFKNPYIASERAVYHYGFLAPLAAILSLARESIFISFFDLSNYLFSYQIATSLIFLQFVSFYFFFSDTRKWIVAVTIMFVCSSYKWIYAAIVYLSSSVMNGFDTPFGFKTPANDLLFSSHYVFSGLFLLYIFWYFVNLNSQDTLLQRRLTTTTACVAAFLLPVINAFSIFVVVALFLSNFLISAFIVRKVLPVIKQAAFTLTLPILSYVGYMTLVSSDSSQSTSYWSFSAATIPLLIMSLAVNFGPLIYLFLKSKNYREKQWLMALCSVLLIVAIMATFRISSGIESDDSFNTTRRLGASLGWIMLIVINPDVLRGIARWLVYPASLTLFAQYYGFHVIDFLHESRNERVSAEMFDARVPYYFDKKSWRATERVSFNFDLIIGNFSCGSPSSLAALRYSQKLKIVESKLPLDDCDGLTNAKGITLDGRVFKFGN